MTLGSGSKVHTSPRIRAIGLAICNLRTLVAGAELELALAGSPRAGWRSKEFGSDGSDSGWYRSPNLRSNLLWPAGG